MEQTIGKRISENRKRLGLTQDALAEKLGVTAQAVSKWENDQSCPDITMLPKLAAIFGITTDTLLGVESTQNIHEAEIVEEDVQESEGIHVQKGSWEFKWDSGKRGALSFAALVLLVGILSFVSKFLQRDISFWDILWPSAFLVFGISRLFQKFSMFAVGSVLLGGYYLMHNLWLWRLQIAGELIFPLIIVFLGLTLLIDALRKPRKPKFRISKNGVKLCDENEKNTNTFTTDTDSFDCSLAFGGKKHDIQLPLLRWGNANCAFGDLTVDLSGCEKISEDCQIDAKCCFGELTILVPKKYRAQIDSATTLAGVDVKGQPDPDPQGVIEIHAAVSFGEILIKYI